MNISKELGDALNAQFTVELANSLFYLQRALEMEAVPFDGFAKFFSKASLEEREHAVKIKDFLLRRNYTPSIGSTAGLSSLATTDPLASFTAALEAENRNTERILALCELADEGEDEDMEIFLQWFITEQGDSEKELTDIIRLLRLSQNSIAALLEIDERVGEL